ncbi:hypothetical protein LSAT2_028350 [Lamellibrachia satsuma]|nr:hypothetical protein LSAT2_028350 [Lamellibrachia satsuma]
MSMIFVRCIKLVTACVVVSLCVDISTRTAASDTWTKSEFPNPQLDVDDCGNNGSKSLVCDPARLLTRQGVGHRKKDYSRSMGLGLGAVHPKLSGSTIDTETRERVKWGLSSYATESQSIVCRTVEGYHVRPTSTWAEVNTGRDLQGPISTWAEVNTGRDRRVEIAKGRDRRTPPTVPFDGTTRSRLHL